MVHHHLSEQMGMRIHRPLHAVTVPEVQVGIRGMIKEHLGTGHRSARLAKVVIVDLQRQPVQVVQKLELPCSTNAPANIGCTAPRHTRICSTLWWCSRFAAPWHTSGTASRVVSDSAPGFNSTPPTGPRASRGGPPMPSPAFRGRDNANPNGPYTPGSERDREASSYTSPSNARFLVRFEMVLHRPIVAGTIIWTR